MQLDPSQLRSTFSGKVIMPGDTDYDKSRAVFYGGIDKHPAAIIMAKSAEDVSKAILLAKSSGLELAVRSGGHSIAGHCVSEGGIVIDFREMKNFEINKSDKTVWVEPGMKTGELTNELDKDNFVLGFGDTGSVGVGGITLNGGVGYLVRKFGLAIDNLLAAEIVTADGKVLNIDAQNYPDLFWAIRGGGGNFGVITRFKFRLHELSEALGGMLILPVTPEVISGFMSESKKAHQELSSIINIMPAPPMPFLPEEYHGKLIVMALMVYAGDVQTGEKVLAPFRSLAKPLADMIKPMRYKDIFFPEDESYHPTAVSKTFFMNDVSNETANTIIEALNNSDASMRVVQLRVLGGAMAQIDPQATAFAHRQNLIMANIASFYNGDEEKTKRQKWVDDYSAKLNRGDLSAYVGFIGDEGIERVRDAYPTETWNKLLEIKKRYDPSNLFKLNQNIW